MHKKLLTLLIGSLSLGLYGCSTVQAPAQTLSPITSGTTKNSHFLVTPGDDVVGNTYRVQVEPGDTLISVAQANNIGNSAMELANPGKHGRLFFDSSVLIPAQFILPPEQYRKGIVINIGALRLYYFGGSNEVLTFPVSLGRDGWRTPLIQNYVYRKEAAPSWHAPASVRQYMADNHAKTLPDVVPPGPNNPLGDYAIFLQMNGYLIHGTNDPANIGRYVSSGCVRMYNFDVAQLFPLVGRGTPVRIIYYPNLVGWRDNDLYLEAHAPINSQGEYQEIPIQQVVADATANHHATVDWNAVNHALEQHDGIPVVIGHTAA